jgi:hypothetical protein
MSLGDKICCVIACDAGFFGQAKACIASLDRFRDRSRVELKLIGIALEPPQRRWLEEREIELFTGLEMFPRFADAPEHAVALTCRPYINTAFPGYGAYLWVDADVRFLEPEGLQCYTENVWHPRTNIVITHESEPAYQINSYPDVGRAHHHAKYRRLLEAFGPDVADRLQYFNFYNAGLYALRAESPIWEPYRRNLELAMRAPAASQPDQDTLNVAIMEVGGVMRARSTMNWLCSMCPPVRSADGSHWCHPWELDKKICVAHLSNSTHVFPNTDPPRTWLDHYRDIGLPV